MTSAETLAVVDETDGYPRADGELHHGLTVWELGEDGDCYMIEGHDLRRTMAAFSSFYRGRCGPREFKTGDVKPAQRWAVIVDNCGCTAAQHAQHCLDADEHGPDCDCDHRGLPPCQEEYGWIAQHAKAETPGALAVTWVRL